MRLRILVIPLVVCVAIAATAAMLWLRPGPATAGVATPTPPPTATPTPFATVDLTGRWLSVTTTAIPPGLTNSCDVRVIQTGMVINGSITCVGLGAGTISGEITGPTVVSLQTTFLTAETTWTGTIHSADKISGTWTLDFFDPLLVDLDGTFVSTRQPVPMTITAPDTTGSFSYNSLALDASGNPVVSYYDATLSNLDLKILHCGNPNCTAGNSITAPDTTGDVGRWNSLVLDSSGNPVVSYRYSTFSDLRILHCGNPNCTAGNSITSPDTTGDVGLYTSLALDASGFPVVSYYDASAGDLKLLHCDDPDCFGDESANITSPDTMDDVGQYTSLALDGSGFPVVSYFSPTGANLKVLHCGNADCTAGNSITSPDTTGSVGAYSSLALDSDGFPVVSYHLGGIPNELKVLHCDDPNCDGIGESITSPDTAGNVGSWTSLALDNSGFPVVSYYKATGGSLRLLRCGDPNCSSGNTIASPDIVGDVGRYTSLVLESGANPVVSYIGDVFAVGGDLKLLHCGKGNCSATFTVDSTADAVDSTPGDGVCATAGAVCTLRAAIQETNALPGPNKIFVPAGKYALTIPGNGEEAAATGDLDITDDLTIGGAGAPVTYLDASVMGDRVFHVMSGTTVEFASVTIAGGIELLGGGILNEGTLTLDWSTVQFNTGPVSGGGIYNASSGTLTVSLSTVWDNGTSALGGGIYNDGMLSVANSTISANFADVDGGGIYNDSFGTVNLNNVTITKNIADSDEDESGIGPGVFNAFGSVFPRNTIIAGNRIGPDFVGPAGTRDCSGIFTSLGHNLVGNGTDCTWTANLGDLVGTITQPAAIDPELGPLAYNGGLTKMHQISATSPAADAGNDGSTGGGCTTIDQRVVVRPQDADNDGNARCDIGAFELDELVECGAITNLPIPDAGCSLYEFEGSLTITTDVPFMPLFRTAVVTLLDAECPVKGLMTTERDALETLAGNVDKVDLTITSLSGYVGCPGPMSLGSSIESTGILIEDVSLETGVLEFPATGFFTLCITIQTVTTLGSLHNCPDDFDLVDKSPLLLECDIPLSLNSYTCTIPGPGPYKFFNDAGTQVAFATEGTLTLQVTNVGGVAELAEVAGAPLETAVADTSVGLFTALLAGITAAVALGGVAWYARRRWAR